MDVENFSISAFQFSVFQIFLMWFVIGCAVIVWYVSAMNEFQIDLVVEQFRLRVRKVEVLW